MSTVRRRCMEPIRRRGGRAGIAQLLEVRTITTPLSTACPESAMKPMAADTDSGIPETTRR